MLGSEPNQPRHDELDLEVSRAPLQTRRNVVGSAELLSCLNNFPPPISTETFKEIPRFKVQKYSQTTSQYIFVRHVFTVSPTLPAKYLPEVLYAVERLKGGKNQSYLQI